MRVNAEKIQRKHPIVQVFNRIEIRAPLRPLAVLEPFGGDGASQTIHYAWMPCTAHLEAWEINSKRAGVLKGYVPGAEVKCCDAWQSVAGLGPHFDVIVIDNNLLQPPHFEHFDLFPAIFKGLKPHGFLVVSVCPDPGGYYVPRETMLRRQLGERTEGFVKDWDRARADFYGFPRIGDDIYQAQTGRIMPASRFSAADMVPVYTELAIKAGFFTKYHTAIERSRQIKYILLELERARPRAEREEAVRDKLERQDAQTRKP